MIPLRLLSPTALLVLFSSLSAQAEPSWLVRQSSGDWTDSGAWTGEAGVQNWVNASPARIPSGRSVQVNTTVTTGALDLNGVVTLSGNPLTVTGPVSGGGTFRMPNINATGFGTNGLAVETGFPVDIRQTITLADQTNGKIVVAAIGAGTELHFNGFWDGWGSNTRHDVRVAGGARFVFGPDARVNNQMRDIVRARAFFAIGDGHPDNILEFAPGFDADLGSEGNPQGGFSTLRVGTLTMITNATANLPTIHKLKGDGSPTHHGLLIFDQDDGAHWIVRGEDQEYDGGIFWNRNWILTTETNLTSVPMHEPGADVGFGSFGQNPTVLTKRGEGALRLFLAQGYVASTTFRLEEGRVEFHSNPFQTWPSGRMVNSGNHLELELAGGAASVLAPAGEVFSVKSVYFDGSGVLEIGEGRLAVSGAIDAPETSVLRLTLGAADQDQPKIETPLAVINGTLQIHAGSGFGAGAYPLFPAGGEIDASFSFIMAPPGYTATYSNTTRLLTIEAIDVLTYADWAGQWFDSEDALTGPFDDFSGDGHVNALAYLFEADPREPGAAARSPHAPRMEQTAEGPFFAYDHIAGRSSVRITPEGSADLLTWEALIPDFPDSPVTTHDGFRARFPAEANAHRFFRLRLEHAE